MGLCTSPGLNSGTRRPDTCPQLCSREDGHFRDEGDSSFMTTLTLQVKALKAALNRQARKVWIIFIECALGTMADYGWVRGLE